MQVMRFILASLTTTILMTSLDVAVAAEDADEVVAPASLRGSKSRIILDDLSSLQRKVLSLVDAIDTNQQTIKPMVR